MNYERIARLHKATKEICASYKNYEHNIKVLSKALNNNMLSVFDSVDHFDQCKKDLKHNLNYTYDKYDLNEDQKKIVLISAHIMLENLNKHH